MARYCVGRSEFDRFRDAEANWQDFRELSGSDFDWWTLPERTETSICREAQCKVRRLGLAQDFRVLLCSDGDTPTIVIQQDTWED
jgi:hypothetical protein